MPQLVVHQLEKTVDLLVFVVTGVYNTVVLRKNAQIHQRGHRLPLGEQIALLPVVGAGRGGGEVVGDAAAPELFAVLAVGDRFPREHSAQLPVVGEQLLQTAEGAVSVEIFMKGFFVCEALQLPHSLSPQLHGAQRELIRRFAALALRGAPRELYRILQPAQLGQQTRSIHNASVREKFSPLYPNRILLHSPL